MAESKVFKLMNGVNAEMLGLALEEYLRENKAMTVQAGKTTGGYIVQGKQDADTWKKTSGTDLAITIQLFEAGDVVNITIGYGKWSDKVGAGVVGWLIFPPLLATAAMGAYKQKKLPNELFNFIEGFILSGGQNASIGLVAGRYLSGNEIICKNCKTPNQKGQKFCTNCGATLLITCANCGANLNEHDKFCSECGTTVVHTK